MFKKMTLYFLLSCISLSSANNNILSQKGKSILSLAQLAEHNTTNTLPILSHSSYRYSLTENDLQNAKSIAIEFYNKEPYNGIIFIFPINDNSPRYDDEILTSRYSIGNIIIFAILTSMDIQEGNPERYIYIGRDSKTSPWEVITEGF